MKKPHFYKSHCRLGLINIPYGSDEKNIGVEEGPDAILSRDFLANLPTYAVGKFIFSDPDKTPRVKYQEIIAKEYREFADLITKTIKENEVQVVIGGDNSSTFSSVLSLLDRYSADEIGYIQFDSHADIHTFQSSPSQNFHGMYVRAFVDDIGSPMIQKPIKRNIPAKSIVYVGNLVIEPEEKEFIDKNNIQIFSRDDILNKKTAEFIQNFAKNKKHLHIAFDIDVFDASLEPATGILNPNGLFPEDIFPLLEILSKFPWISIDLVEVNPHKKGIKNTLKLARKVLSTLLA